MKGGGSHARVRAFRDWDCENSENLVHAHTCVFKTAESAENLVQGCELKLHPFVWQSHFTISS